eukprot:gene10066-1816_t
MGHCTDLVASGSDDSTCKLWNAETCTLRATLRGHTDPVKAVAVSHDDLYVATGGWDNTIRVWNSCSANCVLVLHCPSVTALAFTPHGAYLVSGHSDGTCRLWPCAGTTHLCSVVPTGCAATKMGPEPPYPPPDWSPNDLLEDLLQAFSAKMQTSWVGLPGHTSVVRGVACSPCGSWAVSGGLDEQLLLWSLPTLYWPPDAPHCPDALGDFTPHFNCTAHAEGVNALAVSHCGTFVVTGGLDRTCRVWAVQGQPPADCDPACRASDTCWARSLVLRYSVSYGPRIRHSISSVSIACDGTLFVAGSRDATCKVWNVRSGEEVRLLSGHVRRQWNQQIATSVFCAT